MVMPMGIVPGVIPMAVMAQQVVSYAMISKKLRKNTAMKVLVIFPTAWLVMPMVKRMAAVMVAVAAMMTMIDVL